MRFIFGAPVAFVAPAVGYMLNWIVAWFVKGVPNIATTYWPANIFCASNGDITLFCGRSPGDLEHFMLVFFFVACIIGWESIRILLPNAQGPVETGGRPGVGPTFTRIVAWSIVALPSLILAPHIYLTIKAMPAAFSYYGWGTETLVDFLRSWIAGASFMLLYAIARRGGSTGFA
ncbi:MAG: hypothetical protein OEN55_03950 [Alphaproteobacteria bacterium]|nr:hypothetical protein [Alphaproteobacteria bacterium]